MRDYVLLCSKNLTKALKTDIICLCVSPLCVLEMIRWREIVDQRRTFGEFISRPEKPQLADSS